MMIEGNSLVDSPVKHDDIPQSQLLSKHENVGLNGANSDSQLPFESLADSSMVTLAPYQSFQSSDEMNIRDSKRLSTESFGVAATRLIDSEGVTHPDIQKQPEAESAMNMIEEVKKVSFHDNILFHTPKKINKEDNITESFSEAMINKNEDYRLLQQQQSHQQQEEKEPQKQPHDEKEEESYDKVDMQNGSTDANDQDPNQIQVQDLTVVSLSSPDSPAGSQKFYLTFIPPDEGTPAAAALAGTAPIPFHKYMLINRSDALHTYITRS
jgi:hypothetical protein